MTTKYRVRIGFFPEVQQGSSRLYYEGGNEIELTPEQYNLVKHMVEEIPVKKEPKNAPVQS
mgnify:FL=1